MSPTESCLQRPSLLRRQHLILVFYKSPINIDLQSIPRRNQPLRSAGGWCWFVLREKYCWLVVGGWFVLREKYCWLVADKPSEQADCQR
jgi:hypothetical protein